MGQRSRGLLAQADDPLPAEPLLSTAGIIQMDDRFISYKCHKLHYFPQTGKLRVKIHQGFFPVKVYPAGQYTGIDPMQVLQ